MKGPTNEDSIFIGKPVCTHSNHFRANSSSTVTPRPVNVWTKSCACRYLCMTYANSSSSIKCTYHRSLSTFCIDVHSKGLTGSLVSGVTPCWSSQDTYSWPNVPGAHVARRLSKSMVLVCTIGRSRRIFLPLSDSSICSRIFSRARLPVVSPSVATISKEHRFNMLNLYSCGQHNRTSSLGICKGCEGRSNCQERPLRRCDRDMGIIQFPTRIRSLDVCELIVPNSCVIPRSPTCSFRGNGTSTQWTETMASQSRYSWSCNCGNEPSSKDHFKVSNSWQHKMRKINVCADNNWSR